LVSSELSRLQLRELFSQPAHHGQVALALVAVERLLERGGGFVAPAAGSEHLGEVAKRVSLTWFACDGAETRGRFCDPRLDRLMLRAAELEATNERQAAIVWADVDRRVADAGAAIPLVTPRAVEFVSARVRNYQNHPIWGLIVDQVWLR
jgi:hypothetical protein